MKETTRLALVAGACAALASSGAAGQTSAAETCQAALMKDVLSYMSTDQQKYSYFAQIDERTFDQLKIDANAEVGVPIPLLGDMVDVIKASASYSQFVQKRREYFQRVGYTQDVNREVRDVRVVTSPVAYAAWSQCIQVFAANSHSVAIWKDQEDAATVHVQIRNNTPVRLRLVSILLNGSVPGVLAGKAFADQTVLNAGGTRSLLIQRGGSGPLKLSIETNPQFPGLFVESEWGAPPPRLSATLELTYQTTSLEDRGERRGDTWPTPELHEVPCRNDPCTGDRKWQLATGTLHVHASAGRRLRNPRLQCDVDNRGACAWGNDQANARCYVEQGETHALCTTTTGSRAHRDVIIADEYEIVSHAQPAPPQPVLLFSGSQFTLRVPANAASAVVRYQTPAGVGTMKVGEQASSDGVLVFIGRTDAADAAYFTYRLMAP
jgi:hypothetical protein